MHTGWKGQHFVKYVIKEVDKQIVKVYLPPFSYPLTGFLVVILQPISLEELAYFFHKIFTGQIPYNWYHWTMGCP